MIVTVPDLYAVNETQAGDLLRRIAVVGGELRGHLTGFRRDRLNGWLLQPTDGSGEILIVPPGARRQKLPTAYERILIGQVDERAERIDLSAARWIRHPQLAEDVDHGAVVDSWRDSFSYVQEDLERGIKGLRKPQIGAFHAAHAHWSVSNAPATIVMPTGTGKTDTMVSIQVSACCRRVLVVVPTDALRTQLAEKFLKLGVLREDGASILGGAARYPAVCVLKHMPKTVEAVEALFSRAHVIVTTSSIAGQCTPEIQEQMARLCSHLFIDEAHHAEAPTWRAFKERFRERPILQFTATPFREDGKPLDGKLIYVYPLKSAQEDGYFRPIRFVGVVEFDPRRADEAIATAAIAQLRQDYELGHILMARVDSVARAAQVYEIYRRYPEFNPVQIHTGMSARERKEARRKIINKEARIIVCVDMLGEGFDLPELKVAAFHDIRKTLAVTLQLAGRFTRARPDLGDATFIANTADVEVRDELRKLYARDPDWNRLLPEFSDAAISGERSLQDFVAGFTDFADEIPLHSVRPALSTVVYRTRCRDWRPANALTGMPAIASCGHVHLATNEAEHTAVIVVGRSIRLPWAESEAVFSWDWELYIVYWWREEGLLFINSSTNAGAFKRLAEAVAGGDVELIRGQQVFRSFAGVTRLELNNVGLSEQLGRNVSFTGRMGASVAPALREAQLRRARKSVLAGTGYEGGGHAAVGASRKGRIWSHRRGRLDEFVQWCRSIGTKLLDESIDPDAVLHGTLESTIVSSRPDGMPIAVDWPEEIYTSVEKPWAISFGQRVRHISELSLEMVAPTLAGTLRFAIVAEDARAEFELEFFRRGEADDYRFVRRWDEPVQVIYGEAEQAAASFFGEHPPRIWFSDGASLEGNEYTPLKSELPPYDPARITAWDWSGVDIRKESLGDTQAADSIQARVIAELVRADYDLVFDDDEAGEAADVIAVRLVGGVQAPAMIEVEFYHLKYSSVAEPGARVGDLYVVCGQAQTSIRWMSSYQTRTDLFTHLLRRESKRRVRGRPSRFAKGDIHLVETLRGISLTTPLSLKITVVQPGLSKSRVSQTQLQLLAVTDNYLMETYRLPFEVIASP